VLPSGELPRKRDHVLVDVQGSPHEMMLAHHRITASATVLLLLSAHHSTARRPRKGARGEHSRYLEHMDTPDIAVDHEVLVIGAGFSGIGAAIKLDQAGFHDFVVLEAGDGVGGAWHWNTYPGIAVDIPSFSYQFSFEKRSDWSRVYAPGKELKSYAEHCVDKYGVRDRIRLNTKVVGARFDEDAHAWRIETASGEQITARFVIGATGVFSQPKPPEIPGIEAFAGTTMHTARWDHSVDLRGKRVGVIGTGASAIQIIPAIAPEVARVTVFQRTPIWCLPKLDAPMSPLARRVLRSVPGAELAARWASQAFVELTFVLAAHFAGIFPSLTARGEGSARRMLREVRDPVVREKLTPQYSLGCKRPSFSNEYIPTFNRDNVLLETAAIEAITPTGVCTAEGVEHPVDVLVLATGFKVFESGNMPAFEMLGTGGVHLEEWWDANRLQAYEGVSVPGFPNSFSILGPYGFNGQSYFGLIETQMRHIVRCLKRARRDGATRVEITPEANRRYFESMLGRRHNQVFFRGSCGNANSYYFDKHGDAPFRPSLTLEAAWRSARFDLDDYAFAP
jgi:cation diffusion facilitator CzcD-associated flavoprotein CzcO